MSSYQITTARSAFSEEIASAPYRCAGCGGRIPQGATMHTKPYYRKGRVIGATRLHNLNACWEDYDESAVNTLIHRRDNRRKL